MERWIEKVAIVTGASAGIGAAIAEKLVEEGLTVAGFARRKEKVEQLAKQLTTAKGKLYGVKVDISKETEVIEGFNWVEKNLGPIHILINNAGISKADTLINGNAKIWKDVIDTNIFGLCVATREAIKSMKKNGVDGHIVHMNSTCGHKVVNIPRTNVYQATKHAVTALAETVKKELLQNNLQIKVTSVSPGFVQTEIFEAGGYNIDGYPLLHPNDIANGVLYVLGTPPHVQVSELTIKPVGEPF